MKTAMFLVQPPQSSSFATIVRQHQAMVFSIGWHFLRDRAVAEELAQDAFLQLHRNLASIESPAHLTNWLRRVMTRRCIDHARRAKLRPRVALDEAPEPSVAASEVDPFLTSLLDRQIARLPERSRASRACSSCCWFFSQRDTAPIVLEMTTMAIKIRMPFINAPLGCRESETYRPPSLFCVPMPAMLLRIVVSACRFFML